MSQTPGPSDAPYPAPPPGPYTPPSGPYTPPTGPYTAPSGPSVSPWPPPQPPAGPPGTYASDPYGSQPTPSGRPPLDVVSVVSLVTAALGLTLVGLVTGIVGLGRTTRGRRRGRGLAVGGIVVSVGVALLQVLVLAAVWPSVSEGFREGWDEALAEGQPVGPVDATEGTDAEGVELVGPNDLEVGHCFQDPVEEEFYEVSVVGCGTSHDGEVVALVTLEGVRWPGDDEIDEAAWDACSTATATAFDEAGVDGTGLEYWNFTPTREGWVLYGDRDVRCLAYDPDGPLEAPILP